MRAQKRLHWRGQGVKPNAVDRRDRHRASDDVGTLAQPIFERGQPLDDGARLAEQQLPGLGDLEAAAGAAIDQAAAVMAFERTELLADRRLGDEVEPGGAREAAGLDQVTESLEGFEHH